MKIRFQILGVMAALLAPPVISAAPNVELVRVWPEYRAESTVLRLADFFRGGDRNDSPNYHRTEPAEREGLYFVIRLTEPNGSALPDGTIRLHIIAPDASEPQVFNFPYEPEGRSTLKVEVGLTGESWPFGNVLPLAWRLEVLDRNETVVASRNSFLWE